MALTNSGGLVGQISGRLGGDVYSSNRYGTYVRKGTIPVTSTTPAALQAKANLTAASQAWQGTTAAQKLAWGGWAETNPVVNRLGQSVILTGHAAYVQINSRLLSLAVPQITDPPIIPAPLPLTTLSLAADIGAGDVAVTWTATPIGAADYLWIQAAVVDSAGINFIENIVRFVGRSGAAEASPFDIESLITARFGTLIVGQELHVKVGVVGAVTGLLSPLLRARATVVTT